MDNYGPNTEQVLRDKFVFAHKKIVRQKEAALLANPKNQKGVIAELKQLCGVLHRLSQKYVPQTLHTLHDFNTLLQATKSLKRLGLVQAVIPEMHAAATTTDNAVILSSIEYRTLYNKTVAALATIADLGAKNSPPGTPDFQRGVQEGYRRASDVAVLFLEDIQLRG